MTRGVRPSYTCKMRMLKIEDSSSVSEIGYDVARATMAVRFVAGSLYEYANVDHALFGRILSASSVGKILDSEVKKNPAAYPCTKIEDVVRLQKGAVVSLKINCHAQVLDVGVSHGLTYHLRLSGEGFTRGTREVWVDATELELP